MTTHSIALVGSILLLATSVLGAALPKSRTIYFQGNHSLNDSALLKMTGLDKDPSLLPSQVRARLLTTGMFSRVHIRSSATSLTISVIEKTSWFALPYFSADVGSVSYGGAGGKVAFLGEDAQLLGRFQFGTNDAEGSMIVRDEYFLDSDFVLGASLDFERAQHRIFSERHVSARTDNSNTGGSVLTGYHLFSDHFLGLNTYVEQHRFQDQAREEQSGLQISHRVYFDWGRLRVNEGLTQGLTTRLYYERTNPLGDFRFQKSGISLRGSPLLNRETNWIIESRLEAGRGLPYYQRFEVGGANLRSFPSQQFRDDASLVIQNDLLLFSFPVWGAILRPLVYLDWAFIEHSGRSGTGTGLEIFLRNIAMPAVEVFAGYGVNPNGFSAFAAVGPRF